MVRASANMSNNISSRKISIENKQKSRLSIALIMLMIFSVAAPSMSQTPQVLEDPEVRYNTANGTLDDASTSTLLSNLNTSNPIEVIGVMDDSQQVHLVWIENGILRQKHHIYLL